MRARRPLWLLDLDNTLHDAVQHILPRIDRAMTDYVMQHLKIGQAQASDLRLHYWRRYGATLLGMVRHHGVDPAHFLAHTHPFPDLDRLVSRDLRLAHMLRRLPGRKVVLTNAPRAYAREVIAALGIRPVLDGLISIEDMRHAGRWMPKPSRPMLRKVLARLRRPAGQCVLVEDTVDNLRAARHCGLQTVWVSGIVRSVATGHPRHRPGHGAVDLHLKSVVQLARTSLVRLSNERR